VPASGSIRSVLTVKTCGQCEIYPGGLCQISYSGRESEGYDDEEMSRSHKGRNTAQHECLRRSSFKRITWDPRVDLKVRNLETLWPWDRSSDYTMVSRAKL